MIEKAEYEDENHDGDTSRLDASLLELSRGNGPRDENDEHADGGNSEKDAATESLDKEGRGQGKGEVPDIKKPVDEGLCVLVRNTDGVHDTCEV